MKRIVVIGTVLLLAACVKETVEPTSSANYAMTSARYADFELHNYRQYHLHGRQFNGDADTNLTRSIAYQYTFDWLREQLDARGLIESATPSPGVLSIRFGLVSEKELNDEKIAQIIGSSPGLQSANGDKLSFGLGFFDGEIPLWKGVIQGIPKEHVSQDERKVRFETALSELLQTPLK